jgi:hypothetical protein
MYPESLVDLIKPKCLGTTATWRLADCGYLGHVRVEINAVWPDTVPRVGLTLAPLLWLHLTWGSAIHVNDSAADVTTEFSHATSRWFVRFFVMFSLKYNQQMQRYTIFFIIVNALRVSGGFSAHHQELKSINNNKEYCITLHLVGCI